MNHVIRPPEPARRRALPWPLLAAILAAGLGCQRDAVTHYRVPKESAPAPAAPAMPPAGMGGAMGAGEVPAPPAPAKGAGLKGKLPAGWTEEKGVSSMRYATLKAPLPGKLDISLTYLPGAAGGELANVNRWRAQVGLPAWDEAALAKARTSLRTKAGQVAAFDFTGEGPARSRMVVGLLTTAGGDSWFVKMVGDEAPVAKAKPEFMRYLESLSLD